MSGDPEEAIRRDSFEGDGAARSTSRMEAFADAVFAIAITLTIVELEMPEAGTGADLGDELLRLWPSYLGDVLASGVIGIYWVLHHYSGAIYRTTGHYFNLATVLFLAAISFVAFPARVFAEHVAHPDSRAEGAQYFAIGLAIVSVTWLIKWAVGRRTGHVDQRLDHGYLRGLDRIYVVSALLSVLAAGLSFVSWPLGIGLAGAVTLFYLRPLPTPVYPDGESPTIEGEENM